MNAYTNLDGGSYISYSYKNMLNKSLHTLEGIVKGIAIDGIINADELAELNSWCDDYAGIMRSPFTEMIPVIKEAIADGVLSGEEIEDILWFCQNLTFPNQYFDLIASDVLRLQGILHGIMADNRITAEELEQLHAWCEENIHLKGVYPYDEIESVIVSILHDGRVDRREHDFLKVFFREFIYLPTTSRIDREEIAVLKKSFTISGICAAKPCISVKGHTFCITSVLSRTGRDVMIRNIEELGGIYQNRVTEELNYLVVGAGSNPCWAFSCYGRKVEQAMALRKKGVNIVIIQEHDFWEGIG